MHGFSRWARAVGAGPFALLSWLLLGCSGTRSVTLGSCGNGVVESGEDCDGAGACTNCRFECGACPSGFACDAVAGFCRSPSGQFRTQPVDAESGGRLLVADFDGDHRDDLLMLSYFGPSSVLYFDENGRVQRSVMLPVSESAAVADVTADQRPDVILGGETVTAFRSISARQFSPLLSAVRNVAPGSKLFGADVDCDGLRDFLLLEHHQLSRVSSSGKLTVPATLQISAQALHDLEEPAQGARNELTAVGTFDSEAGVACDMLALPAPITGAVDVYAPATPRGGSFKRARVRYDVTVSASRWLFAHINDDTMTDLLVTNQEQQWVSYGVGDGSFHSDPDALPLPNMGGADNLARTFSNQGAEVLAIGELDSTPGPDFFLAGYTAETADYYWSARVMDLTQDGLPDVVAVGDSKRIGLFRGHPSGLTSRLTLRANGLPSIQDVGDFDGDGASDLLLSETSAASSSSTLASVLFAPVTSEAAAPVGLAELEGIEQLSAAYLDDELSGRDANADIGVLFASEESQLQLGFLAGGSDRLLRSQLPQVSDDSAEVSISNRMPVLGHLSSPAASELVVIRSKLAPDGGQESTRLELFRVAASGIAPLDGSSNPPLDTTLDTFVGVNALDVDGDGVDELYAVTAATLDDTTHPVALIQLRLRDGNFVRKNLLELEGIDSSLPQDANSDGFVDLVLMARTGLVVLTASSERSAGKLHVFSRDALPCELPDYSFVQADQDPERELLLSCVGLGLEPPASWFGAQDGVPLPDVTLSLFDVDWESDRLLRLSESPGKASSRLVTGDFNGDGVEDVAGGSYQLAILFGVPKQ